MIATVIPSVLTFLLSTTPVPTMTATPMPPAMATAKAKTDRLEFVLPTSTSTPKANVPQKWKDEARKYRKIRGWAEEQERMIRYAQDILHEDADAYEWTANRKDVDPAVARTARMMADSTRQYARKLGDLENLMLNVNVAATNAIRRRHQNPYKEDSEVVVKDAVKRWYENNTLRSAVGLMVFIAFFAWLIVIATRTEPEKDPQK